MDLRLPRLKIQHVAFISIFLCFIIVNADKIHDPDMWWHLKAGEFIFDKGAVPKADTWSFSNSGHFWIAHEWGSELIYYAAYKLWLFRGLFTVNLLFLSLTYFLFGRLIYTRADRDLSVTTAVVIVCTVFSSLFWVFRPHLLAYLFFISFMLVLELFARGKNYLWVLPPMMVLWVNMHGSFIMGIVLICIYLASGMVAVDYGRLTARKWERGQLKTLGIVLALTAAAIAINPNGLKMYYYPFFTVNSKAIVENITEWSSPDFHHPIFKAFLAYLFIVYSTLIVSKRQVRVSDMLLLGLFTYLAMFGARNVALFMFATGPMWGEHLAGFLSRERQQRQLTAVNWLLLGAVVVWGILAFPPQMTVDEQVNRERFPVNAVEYMRKNDLRGTLFNDYTWGGYLIWTRSAENKIFIDGRADIYEDRVLPEYMRITKLKPDAYDLLLKYNPRFIMLPPAAPVNHLLRAKGDWQVIFQDKTALLYERKTKS